MSVRFEPQSPSRQRKLVGRKRRKKKINTALKVRTPNSNPNSNNKFEFEVHFRSPSDRTFRLTMRISQLVPKLNEIESYIKSTFSGDFKLTYVTYPHIEGKTLSVVKFNDESNLMILLMCYRELVAKVFQRNITDILIDS